jgi:hypothetical protein
MGKRAREGEAESNDRSSKRMKPSATDRLSKLSDELILRVLSFLPVSQLVICQRYDCLFAVHNRAAMLNF